MVFENTERRFQPSYLPYQVLFIVDAFAFCVRCVVVCTFRETIYSTCVFPGIFPLIALKTPAWMRSGAPCVKGVCADVAGSLFL